MIFSIPPWYHPGSLTYPYSPTFWDLLSLHSHTQLGCNLNMPSLWNPSFHNPWPQSVITQSLFHFIKTFGSLNCLLLIKSPSFSSLAEIHESLLQSLSSVCPTLLSSAHTSDLPTLQASSPGSTLWPAPLHFSIRNTTKEKLWND